MGCTDRKTKVLLVLFTTVCIAASLVRNRQKSFSKNDDDIKKNVRDEGKTRRRSFGVAMANGRAIAKSKSRQRLRYAERRRGKTEATTQAQIEEDFKPLLEHIKKEKYSRGRKMEMSNAASNLIQRSGKRFRRPKLVNWDSGLRENRGRRGYDGSSETSTDESTKDRTTRRNTNGAETDPSVVSKRLIFDDESQMWPLASVPYLFSAEISEDKRNNYRRAMQKFTYWSCFRYMEWNTNVSDVLGHSNYLNFINGDGCYAIPGNTYGNGQPISCCSQDVCMHELAHSLGMFHEQTRRISHRYIRINYDNFIYPNGRLFYTRDDRTGSSLDHYNLQSTMHYRQWANSKNKEDVFTILDEEMQYLVEEPERTFYYLFYETQQVYNCKADMCPDFDITCENGGYFAYIRNECTCRCPVGLNPLTGCTTLYTGDDVLKSMSWPEGTFSILKIQDQDCPSGFEYGWIKHWSAADIGISTPFDSCADIGSDDYIVHEFCTKSDSSPDPNTWPFEWDKGSYCIVKKGDCPPGFEEGSLQFYDLEVSDHSNSSFGELPDVTSGQDILLNFCCRSDGDIQDPIKLPTRDPFILLRESDMGCQDVDDMLIEYEYIDFKNRLNVEESQKIGHVPYVITKGMRRFIFHFCYYKPIVVGKDCGRLFELTDAIPSVNISSPNYPANYDNFQKCTWFIKSEPNSKIILNFHDFDFEIVDGGCSDTIEIRYSLPGQVGKMYCGEGFQKTIISQNNSLSLTMRTDYSGSGRGFLATVRMQKLDVDNLCYRYEDGGLTYMGTMDYTREFRKCLPWNEVTHCEHHPFNVGNFDDGLKSNYCRNPGFGYAPWCFYNAYLCLRGYCDVCNLVTCYDLFDDCDDSIDEDPHYCKSDEEAMRGCAKTCGLCGQLQAPPVVSEVRCPRPLCMPFAAIVGTLQLEYSVGESVTYQCVYGAETHTRVCLSDSSWSGGAYTCGACPRGFSYREGSCYKWFDDFVTKLKADLECSRYNAIVSPAKTIAEAEFLESLVKEERSFWIGLNDAVVENSFTWEEDGTELTWSNWTLNQPNDFNNDQDCVIVDYKTRSWDDVNCEVGDFHSFICKLPQSDPRMCADRRRDCLSNIMEVPDVCSRFPQFAHEVCPASCSECGEGDIVCYEPEVPANATKETLLDSSILPGKYFTYSCQPGYSLASGNLIRACLISRDLTGKPPVCLADNEVETANNVIDMRSRLYLPPPLIAVISDNKAMSAHKNGDITQWTFYSISNTSLTLQVYRSIGNDMFLLVGQNVINSTKDDRIRTVRIPEGERITVKTDDLIGIHYGSSSGGIPYDICSVEYSPEGVNVLVVDIRQNDMITNQTYLFKKTTYYGECRLYSLGVHIL